MLQDITISNSHKTFLIFIFSKQNFIKENKIETTGSVVINNYWVGTLFKGKDALKHYD